MAEAPPAPSLAHNLPRPLTPFVGREAELRLLIERLDSPDTCLLTLAGPGGVGKTRLAQHAAWEQVGAFADGVYWIPLASVITPSLVASSIAQSIGFHFEGAEDPQAQLLNYLREKEMLLVFDNFEQLLSPEPELTPGRNEGQGIAATHLLLSILQSAPRISIMVTSRSVWDCKPSFCSTWPACRFLPGRMDDPSILRRRRTHQPAAIRLIISPN